MADEYADDDREISENPRHLAQKNANRSGGKFAAGLKGTSGYLKPKKQVYKEINEALEVETPSVKRRRA